MLKDSEEIYKRRKLFLMPHSRPLSVASTTTVAATMANATPPTTPPTPPLNMMMMSAERRNALMAQTATTSLASSPQANNTTNHNAKSLNNAAYNASLTPKTMAASLLATVAAAAAVSTEAASSPPATVTCSPVATASATLVQDHYSLRWNNHQYHILRAFDALLQSKALVDVTLVCAETSIHAHKMVLSACSPFFQRVFAETPCKHPVIVLKDFRGWVVRAIVDFMYRGEISVPQERLQTLIQAGESLQVRGLVESSAREQTCRRANTPDEYGLLNTSLFSSPDLERCSSFEEETPTMVTASSKVLLPSRLFRDTVSNRRECADKRLLDPQTSNQLEIDTETEAEAETHSEIDNEHDMQRGDYSGFQADVCTSPMPRRKQARPRRRSGELPPSPIPTPLEHTQTTPITTTTTTITTPPHVAENVLDLNKEAAAHVQNLEALKTVIKTEFAEPMDDDGPAEQDRPNCNNGETDSGNGNDSRENIISQDLSLEKLRSPTYATSTLQQTETIFPSHLENEDKILEEDDQEHDHIDHDSEEMDEFMNTSDEIICESSLTISDGPEDLCTTKKDNDMSGSHSISEHDQHHSKNNNNNNNSSSKLNNNNNNNNCIELSMKENKLLHKSFGSSMSSSSSLLNPFAATSLRDLRLDRSHISGGGGSNSTAENQNKMDVLEAQMQAAAAAAAAAANCENPFQHMEHQVDLSLAAAAAAAAVSHHHTREREHAMQREHREMQQQHNVYASSLLGQMSMSGMPNFGHGPGAAGPPSGSGHERMEDNINRLNKDFGANSPLSLPNHFNLGDGSTHPSSPLPFPGMSSALALTPPHSEYKYRQFSDSIEHFTMKLNFSRNE